MIRDGDHLGRTLVIFNTFSWCRGERQRTPQEEGQTPSSISPFGARHVVQNPGILRMDDVAPCPPTLQICSDSRRRTGHYKYAVIRAGVHLGGALDRPRL